MQHHFSNRRGFRASRTNTRGFTLVELAIAIAAIGILSALLLRGTGILGKSKGAVEGQNLLDTVSAVQSCFQSVTDFTALGATAATGTQYAITNCGREVASQPATATASAITNQFGGARTIARASILGGTNNAVNVSNALVPSDVCTQVVQGQWGNFNTITVTPAGGAAVNVKTAITDQFTPTAMAACGTAITATIAVVQAKH